MAQVQLSFDLEPIQVPAAADIRSSAIVKPPTLIIGWKPFWPDFLHNLADFIARRDAAFVPANVRPGQFWPDVFVQRSMPWKELAQSGILHLLAATLIALTSNAWLGRKEISLDSALSHTTITYYKTEAFMPGVKTASPKTGSHAQSNHDPVKAVQEITSIASDADNSQQTIANLAYPEVLTRTVPLPNMVMQSSPKVAVKAPVLAMPMLAFKTVMPTIEGVHDAVPQRVKTNTDAIEVRAEDAVAAPQLELQAVRKAIDIPTPQAPSAPPPSIDSGVVHSKVAAQLLVLNARPVAPNNEIQLPDGSRKGVFATSPLGREGAAGTPGTDVRLLPEIHSGSRVPILVGSTDPASGLPAGISIAGNKGTELASAITPGVQQAIVQKAVPKLVLDAPSAIRPAVARATNIPRETRPAPDPGPKDEVFGTKRVYQMQINLPNLTSAGGSWIIRFAEMDRSTDTSDLSTPVATTQVDPAYPQTLQGEGVQGTVVVYAVIHADGTVGAIRVLHGVHDRLDENAIRALSRWKFRPATKSGNPVEIEAVVQIPFYASRAAVR